MLCGLFRGESQSLADPLLVPLQLLQAPDTIKSIDLFDQRHLFQLLDGPHRRNAVYSQQVGEQLLAYLFLDQDLPVIGHALVLRKNKKEIADFPPGIVKIRMPYLLHCGQELGGKGFHDIHGQLRIAGNPLQQHLLGDTD